MAKRFNSNNSILRSSPQYNVFGEKTMMSVKVIPPTFRILKSGVLILDNNKKGRILLEWTPRASGGTFTESIRIITCICQFSLCPLTFCTILGGLQRSSQLRFGLSPEEVGFMLHQLPENEVEFVRTTPTTNSTTDALPEKVLKITPGEAGQFSFAVDFEKDGVGGQVVGTAEAALGPLEVVVQLGEYQVIRELMQTSIPILTGWSTQLNLAMSSSIQLAISESGKPQQRAAEDTASV